MKTVFFIFSFLVTININAQTADECKYFQVLSYIRTNLDFNNQLKQYLTSSKIKETEFLDINVTPWVEFIEIRQFKDKLNPDTVEISKDILSNDRLYYQTYNFNPFKSEQLEKIIGKGGNSKLFLTFSKIIGRTLLVEILNSDNMPHRIRRIGSGVKILFIFEQTGMIKTVLFDMVTYN